MIRESPLQRSEILPLYIIIRLPVKMNVLEAVETVSPNKTTFFLFYFTHNNAGAIIHTKEIHTSSAWSVNHVDPLLPEK